MMILYSTQNILAVVPHYSKPSVNRTYEFRMPDKSDFQDSGHISENWSKMWDIQQLSRQHRDEYCNSVKDLVYS